MLVFRRLSFLFFFVLNLCLVTAQGLKKDFETRYNALRTLVNKDLGETKKQANLLISEAEAAQNFRYVAKGYYMLSFVSMLEDNNEACFKFANKALEISTKHNYKEGQALAVRSIGTQYARMNTLDIAMKNFDKALNYLKDVNTEEGFEIRGLINNSKLVALGDGTTPKEVSEKLRVSLDVVDSYEKLSNADLKKNLLVSAYTNVGYNYSDQKKYDSARYYFQQALGIVEPDNLYMLASIHHDLGYLYKQEGEVKKAEDSFNKALSYITSDDASYRSKKIEILKNLALVYEASGDKERFLNTREKVHALLEVKSNNDIKYLEKEIQKKDDTIVNKDKKQNYIRLILFVVLAILLFIGVFSWVVNRNNKKKYQVLRKRFEEMKNERISEARGVLDTDSIKENSPVEDGGVIVEEEDFSVSDKTIERLLFELKSFEEGEIFLTPNFTISHLAIQLETNTKTLSQIIKQFKNQNFNAYINQLRILHFSTKVEEDEAFRKYKLAYIAEYLGYSSASAFSNSFKSVTGMLPSVYLKQFRTSEP